MEEVDKDSVAGKQAEEQAQVQAQEEGGEEELCTDLMASAKTGNADWACWLAHSVVDGCRRYSSEAYTVALEVASMVVEKLAEEAKDVSSSLFLPKPQVAAATTSPCHLFRRA